MQFFIVDAFADEPFAGNPACIVPLPDSTAWPGEARMQAWAAEFNLSETAFFAPNEAGSYDLRWFTPTREVELCGHATLASAFVAYEQLGFEGEAIHFETRSGRLSVRRDGPRLTMDFPTVPSQAADDDIDQLAPLLGATPVALYSGPNYLAVFERQSEVAALTPDFGALANLERAMGVICSAPGDVHDVVSRYFVPAAGINEDPVTGSAHCMLAPVWAERLGQTELRCRQISARGGDVFVTVRGERAELTGSAVLTASGTLAV